MIERLRDLLVPVLGPRQGGAGASDGVQVPGWLKEQLAIELGAA